ncbi:hypothetical protein, partial [Isoptericola haloaureus]
MTIADFAGDHAGAHAAGHGLGHRHGGEGHQPGHGPGSAAYDADNADGGGEKRLPAAGLEAARERARMALRGDSVVVGTARRPCGAETSPRAAAASARDPDQGRTRCVPLRRGFLMSIRRRLVAVTAACLVA